MGDLDMTALISIVGLLVFFALGAFTVYILIELLDYIKRFKAQQWQQLSFERPFGIPQDKFLFYPVRPLRLVPFLLRAEDDDDDTVTGYKKRIRLAFGILALMAVIFFVTSLIG
jgi:hypothetical protein